MTKKTAAKTEAATAKHSGGPDLPFMRSYRSHKVVAAAKVAFVGDAHLVIMVPGASRGDDDMSHHLDVGAEWIGNRMKERGADELGWFISYRDGYTSWSPESEFLDGYTLVQADNTDEAPVETEVAEPVPGPPRLIEKVAKALYESHCEVSEFKSHDWEQEKLVGEPVRWRKFASAFLKRYGVTNK